MDLFSNQKENFTKFFPLLENISTFYQNKSLWEVEYAKLYEAPAEVVAILSIFYGGISIIAVIGNILVIWIVATTKQMHTITNLYIANLAFADVIIGMFCIPFQFQAALLQRWNLPEFMCAFCPFIQALSVNVSIFTLTAIAIDRHRAIINPMRTRPRKFVSKTVIVVIWIAATTFSIPCAIAFRVIQITEIHKDGNIIKNVTRPFCENVNLTDNELQSYRYCLVLVQYLIPFCIISFIYIHMAIKLWGSRTPGNAEHARDIALLKNKKKVIKMLIIVVVVFGVCWLPLQTYNILYVTWPDVNEYQFINIIWFCCDWLAMSNSCYNPFIYGIYNEKFKREFNRKFSICLFKFNESGLPDRTLSAYTRASSIRSTYTTHNKSSNYRKHVYVNYRQHDSIVKATEEFKETDEMQNLKQTNMNNKNNSVVLLENDENKMQQQKHYNYQQIDVNNSNENKTIYDALEKDKWDHEYECDRTFKLNNNARTKLNLLSSTTLKVCTDYVINKSNNIPKHENNKTCDGEKKIFLMQQNENSNKIDLIQNDSENATSEELIDIEMFEYKYCAGQSDGKKICVKFNDFD